jgi:hypothetical protein
MHKTTLAALLAAFLLLCCQDKKHGSENDVDAARNFIQAVLENDFDEAENYLLRDSLNKEYFAITRENFRNKNADTLRSYKEASINIHEVRPQGDTVTFIQYSNSFQKVKTPLKVVKQQGEWLVDLKYTFTSNQSVE